MWIIVKSGIVDESTYQNKELTGRDSYNDDEVDVVDVRIMISHITNFKPCYKMHDHCIISLSDGIEIQALESAESVEKKIKNALLLSTN